VGYLAGEQNQDGFNVAIGISAGRFNQGSYSVAMGYETGATSQGIHSTALGHGAGQTSQFDAATAVGRLAGNTDQGSAAVAVGHLAGSAGQGTFAVAVGRDAGKVSQGINATAIGYLAGSSGQSYSAVAVGVAAAQIDQGSESVAVGRYAGKDAQGSYAVAVGSSAGQTDQGTNSVAMGNEAGQTYQGNNAVAMGNLAGETSQGGASVAIGNQAGRYNSATNSIAVGHNAGLSTQGEHSVGVGVGAGQTSQGASSVAVGQDAGRFNQGISATAIGADAGETSQSAYSTAVGRQAGQLNQGGNATAIGREAARTGQGSFGVAVGFEAGETDQHAKTIVLNAFGDQLNTNRADALFIKKIRNTGALSYSSADGEVFGNSSDDRVKFNETYIKNALKTIMKLKPQSYDKATDLESNTYIEQHESGFMAQDIWYDVPEMRHIVILAQTANPTPEKPPAPSDDPADDPDYSAWGEDLSTLNYSQIIPFLTKAVQEVAVEVPRVKTTVSNTWGQNITGLVVSANANKHKTNTVPVVNLSNVSMDKKWYGVVSGEKTDSIDYDTLVDTKGDTRVWVTNLGGPLESGDFITTSNIAPGFTQKQSDDLVCNYTIGKITQDCDFTEPSTVTVKVPRQELSNVTYYIHQFQTGIGEKEYNRIGMESNKTTGYVTMYRKNGSSEEIRQEEYDILDSTEQAEYESFQKLKYYRLDRHETKVPRESHTITEVRQELVDVLDENGQTVWEETNESQPIYTLVDHGTYKAALVTCKLI
jgi:hypothetical protein